jgi:hypothetical protein
VSPVEIGFRFVEQAVAVGQFEEPVLVGVAHDQIDPGLESSLRCELDVAPGGDDRCVRVAASDMADQLP